jgi:chromosome segregation ATPase
MTDDKKQENVVYRISEEKKERMQELIEETHWSSLSEMHRDLANEFVEGTLGTEVALKNQAREIRKEIQDKKAERDRANRHLEELNRQLSSIDERLSKLEKSKKTFSDAVDDLAGQVKDTDFADNQPKIAKNHSDVQELARQYDKTTGEVCDALAERGVETYEVNQR